MRWCPGNHEAFESELAQIQPPLGHGQNEFKLKVFNVSKTLTWLLFSLASKSDLCGLLQPNSRSTYASGWEYPALFDPLLLQQEAIPHPHGFQQGWWLLPSFSPGSHVHTFGLAELHARDALPTPFARQHLINTPPVKWSQWILICVHIHRF